MYHNFDDCHCLDSSSCGETIGGRLFKSNVNQETTDAVISIIPARAYFNLCHHVSCVVVKHRKRKPLLRYYVITKVV